MSEESWWEKYYRRGIWARKTLAPPKPILDIKEMLEKLSEVTDEQWGRYAFRKELLRRKFTEEQRQAYTIRANECGVEYAQKMIREFNTRDPKKLAEKLGATVSFPSRPERSIKGNQVLFAQFAEPDKISVFTDCTERANDAAEEFGLSRYFAEKSIRNILVAHEVFHMVEFKYQDSIFTRTEKINLLPFKIISNWSTIRCLGEMAGMRFAKEVLELPFSPYLLDVFLLHLYHRQKASDLYRAIMKIIFPEQNDKSEETNREFYES